MRSKLETEPEKTTTACGVVNFRMFSTTFKCPEIVNVGVEEWIFDAVIVADLSGEDWKIDVLSAHEPFHRFPCPGYRRC